ncbi:hypothetical protein [Streptomyces albospinus]|nr:hypothetical protein [Streptomyces albospinus]
MKRMYRLAVASLVSTAVVTGGAAAAVAAPAPDAHPGTARHLLDKADKDEKADKDGKEAKGDRAGRVTVSAEANKSGVRAHQEVRIAGKVIGARPGSKVRLQQQDHHRWVDLPVTATTQRHGEYVLHVKPAHRGRTVYRVFCDGVFSHNVTVTVR